MNKKATTRRTIGVLFVLIIIAAAFAYILISVREAKGHCIPNTGLFNILKIWIASYMGVYGITCQ